jgi:hypothetical protein
MFSDGTLLRALAGRLPAAITVAVLGAAVASLGGASCGQVKTQHEPAGVNKTEDFVAGQIVVWFNDGLDAAAIDDWVAKTGGEIIERSRVTPSRVVLAVPAGEEGRYVEAYRQLDVVRAADKDYVLRALPEGGGAGSSDPGKFKIQGN